MAATLRLPPAVTPTEHEKSEWSRMAQAAYHIGRNDIGHKFSVAASIPRNHQIPPARFEELQRDYRDWLCYNQFPTVQS